MFATTIFVDIRFSQHHTARWQYLTFSIAEHWTGQGGPMNWPIHLPYLTPVDFLSVEWFDLINHSEW